MTQVLTTRSPYDTITKDDEWAYDIFEPLEEDHDYGPVATWGIMVYEPMWQESDPIWHTEFGFDTQTEAVEAAEAAILTGRADQVSRDDNYIAIMSGSSWTEGPRAEFATLAQAYAWAAEHGDTADRCDVYEHHVVYDLDLDWRKYPRETLRRVDGAWVRVGP